MQLFVISAASECNRIACVRLVDELLVPGTATVKLNGVFFNQLAYESEIIKTADWSAKARNLGSFEVPCRSYPGSVSRIWVPDTINGFGHLELKISEQTRASAPQTFEEVLDVFEYQKTKRADIEHEATVKRMAINDENAELVEKARAATEAACTSDINPRPSQTEARSMEANAAEQGTVASSQPQAPSTESQETESTYAQIRKAALAAKQKERESL